MKRLSNELKVGLLVVISILLFFILLYKMGNFNFTKETYRIKAVFDYVGGISENAPVRLLGVEVGKVERIELQYDQEPKVFLTLLLDKETRLKTDAKAYVSALGLMGERYIEIVPGSKDSTYLQPGGSITGEDPFRIERFAKKGEEVMQKLSSVITNIQLLTRNVNGMVDENRDGIHKILDNTEAATGNLKEFTSDLKRNPWKLMTKPRDWRKRME